MTKGYIFIDVSYLVFYRFYALKRWFSIAHKDIEIKDDENWLENKIFMSKFEDTLLKTILRIAKVNDIDLCNIIFAFDCHRKNIWRHDIMIDFRNNFKKVSKINDGNDLNTEYKGLREEQHKKQNFTAGGIFDIVRDKILPLFIKANNNKILKHKKAEGDDCIAVAVNYLRDVKKDDKNIWIIASDTDYLQICDNKTKLIDLKENLINKKHLDDKNITRVEYLLNKILTGDVSDNIFPCQLIPDMIPKLKTNYNIIIRKNKNNKYKITKTILTKICGNVVFYNKLKQFMLLDKNDEETYKTFDLIYIDKTHFIYNQKMIDFNYIPSSINKKVYSLME